MNVSQVGINLIKSFEGCQLHSYQDIGGVWTIGYGHTAGVRANDTISQQQADSLLLSDVESFGHAVSDLVKVPINQYQFDSLTSFCYNVGIHAFATSTLLQRVNQRDFTGAANEFGLWIHAGGKVVNGLINRRKAESTLFTRVVETPNNGVIQVVKALVVSDIRNGPSHSSGFVRNTVIGETFNVFQRQGDWHCVGPDCWIDGNGGQNLYWVNNPALKSQTMIQDYTIRSGESLSVIAKRMNTTVGNIMALNPQIKNANVIQAGQIIKVPH
jgi:lysozyme